LAKLKKQKRIRRLLKIVGAVAAVFFILILLLLHLGPGIIKSYIKGQTKDMGFASPALEVRNFNLKKLDIRNLRLGNRFTIPFLSVDYSLPPLLRGDIKKISVSGMKLQLDFDKDKNQWVLRGFESLFNQQNQQKKSEKKDDIPIIRNISVVSSSLQINHRDSSLLIPLELQARCNDKTRSYDFSAVVHPFGEAVRLNGNLNPDSGNGKIKIHSDNLHLENFLSGAGIFPELLLKFRTRVLAEVRLQEWEILHAEVKLSTGDFKLFHPMGQLEGSLDLGFRVSQKLEPIDIDFKAIVNNLSSQQYNLAIDRSFTLILKGKTIDTLEFYFSAFKLSEPRKVQVTGLSGTISGLPGNPRIKGNYRLKTPRYFLAPMIPSLELAGPLPLKGEFYVNPGSGKQTTGWKISGKGSSSGGPFLSYEDVKSKCNHVSLQFTAGGKGGKINSTANITIKGLLITFADFSFAADQILSTTNINSSSAGDFTASGKLRILSAQLTGANGLKAGGITMDLPWSHALPGSDKAGKTGSFNIKSIEISGFNLKDITGQIRQKRRRVEFSGNIHTALEQLRLNLSGSGTLSAEGMSFFLDLTIPPAILPKNTELGKLHPLFKGMQGAGKLSGSVKISPSQSEALIRLRDASLAMDINSEGEKAVVYGLNGEIKLKDLFNLVSEKSQQVTFESLTIGGFPLTHGQLTLEIESPESIFIERGEFGCFNGKILISPLRYTTGSGDFNITLYCDRIDFNRLVNTLMGKEIAFGDAELNGIIPVTISQGIPVFKDGYLYSTPGIKGNIKFRESSVVSGGVLLVEEAVKDFNYDWIKVKMNSAGNLLDVTVLIDGEPAGKLPLTLNTKTRDIVRDRNGKRDLHLKGLTLELHFKDIDLKSLLKQGSKIYLYKKNEK